jgi:hypothetical protein
MAKSLIADLLQSPSAARAALEEELQLKGALAAKPFTGATNPANPISGAMNRLTASQLQQSPLQMQQMVRNLGGGLGSIASALGAPQAGEALRRGGLSPEEQQAEAVAKAARGMARTPEGLREFAEKLRQMNRPDLAERIDEKADELMFKEQERRIKERKLDIEEKKALKASKAQFGSSREYKDSAGNYYSGTQVRNPDTQQIEYDVIPIGSSPDKPVGKLTPIGGAYGETSMEAAGRKVSTATAEAQMTSLQKLGDDTIYPEATKASADIGRYDIMLDLLGDMDTGKLKDWEVAVKGLGKYFGLSDESIASEEVFRSLALRDAISYVGQTKGAISNMEMRLFQQASPALQNTTEGNKLLIEFSRYVANRKVAKADEFARWREANPNGTAAQWQLHLSKWVEANPNKFLLNEERLKNLRSSKTAANKGAEKKADSDDSFASDVEKLKDWLDANPGKEDLVEKMFKKKYPNRNVPVILRVQ